MSKKTNIEISQHEAHEYGRKEYLAKKLKRAKADAHYFDCVCDAVWASRSTVVTKMPHPTGMLHTPFGYKRLTGMYCTKFEDEYIQTLEPGIADIVKKSANMMEAMIWMPVAEVWGWDEGDLEIYEEYMSEYEAAYQNLNLKVMNYIAKKMLALFTMAGIISCVNQKEDDYEQTRFV